MVVVGSNPDRVKIEGSKIRTPVVVPRDVHIMGSVLGLFGPVLVYRYWVRLQMTSLCSLSVAAHKINWAP